MLNKFKFLKNKNFLLITSIIITGLILRLWNFQNLFYFAIDEEKASFIINDIISGLHFPALGYPSSVGFRLGPLLFYLIAPIYKIFGSNPVNLGFFSVFVSVFSMILIYKIGTKINKLTGILSLFFYSISYLNILYDRRGWPVSFHSFIALSVLYSLLKIKNGDQKYLYVLTFFLIAATHFEVATLLFIPLVITIWILLKLKVNRIFIIISIILMVISQSGFIIFDLRHNFLNTKYLINYFNPNAKERVAKNLPLTGIRDVYLAHNLIPSTFARTLFVSSYPNAAIQYANCPQYLAYKQSKIPLILKLAIICIFLIFFYLTFMKFQRNSDESTILIIISAYILLLFTGIAIYTYLFQGEMAEFYLITGFAYFFIILGYIFSKIIKSKIKILAVIFLFIFATLNIQALFKSYNPYGSSHKKDAVKYAISLIGNKSFVLDSFQTCWYSGGYRYLFSYLNHEPLTSYMDQYLEEYYIPNSNLQPEYQVTILTPELVGNNPSGYDRYKDKINTIADFKE